MKSDFSAVERYRTQYPPWSSPVGAHYGLFYVPFRKSVLKILVDRGDVTGWDHVSVSLSNRCPTWAEMAYVKSLFWEDEESVMQFHPKKSVYVNTCVNCLHLWRKFGVEPELPPIQLV